MKKVFQVLLGFGLLGGIGYVLYALGRYVFEAARQLGPAIMGPLFITSVTVFGSVLAIAIG
jgi:hypothetical protein